LSVTCTGGKLSEVSCEELVSESVVLEFGG
jgi:hypothetical protein